MAKKNGPSLVVDALPFLMKPAGFPARHVCVVAGEDDYLRHEVRAVLLDQMMGGDRQTGVNRAATESEPFNLSSFDGSEVDLPDVLDALHERSLFGARERVVLVENADPFVKRYRSKLEAYVERPAQDGRLLLDVPSWLKTTRLAKSIVRLGLTIYCRVPRQGKEATAFVKQLKEWLIFSAQHEHGIQLQRPAVDLLLERMPTEPGILYQEVGKLALLANLKTGVINRQLVSDQVGGWRARRTWDMIDAVAGGRADEALLQLDRLLASGEDPHAILPQMASTLRRFTMAVYLYEKASRRGQRLSLQQALEQTGIRKFNLQSAEAQLRQIGRIRARQLLGWLLAADLELKGYNSRPQQARRVIETLIVRLSRQALPTS